MPKNLTDVSQWNTVAVPVGTDARSAASVETPFQILTDRAKYLIDFLVSLRLSQWFYVEHDSFTSWGGGGTPLLVRPHDICYDASNDLFTAIDQGAVSIISREPGLYASGGGDQPGGQGDCEWQEESDDPATCGGGGAGLGAGHTSAEIATGNSTRVAVGSGATGIVAESSAVSTWTTRNTANSVAFHCIGFGNGLFAIGGASGTLETSSNGQAWTSRTSGISDTIRLIRHNGLSGASAKWMALSDTKVSTSSDGVTWSSTTHGFTSNPLRMTYDAENDRWWVLRDNGSLAYSDNDGASWTGVAGDPLGLSGVGTISKYEVGIDSDNQSGVVVTYERYTGTHPAVSTIDSRRWAIRGNGATYTRTYAPRMYGCQRGGVCFGRDRFVTAGDAGGNFSLRALDL